MVKYECVFCKFSTIRKTEYNRHIETKKHLEKVNQNTNDTQIIPKLYPKKSIIYRCTHCENVFTNASSLGRHKKTCFESKLKDDEVENLKKENERIQKEKDTIQKQLETYETMLKSMTTPQTINYYNYIAQNYPNAPALECQESYEDIHEAETMTLIDVIAMYHYDNKLVSFIGDYIVKVYTHKEPKNQSIWSTDISRLTYIISESCKSGNNWSYDKKGAKTKKIIIEPALQYIRDQLVKFCHVNGGSTKAHILKKMIAANATIQFIDSGELSDKVNRYIAPEFSFKLSDNKSLSLN